MMSRVNEAERALDLPPGYTPVLLRESGDAFAHGLRLRCKLGPERWSRSGATTSSSLPSCWNPPSHWYQRGVRYSSE